MVTFELLYSTPHGIGVIAILLCTVLTVLFMAVSKLFKSNIVGSGIPVTIVYMVLWFLGGALYADIWRYGKWGTWSASIPLPEFFDNASWGFAVALLFTVAWLWWIVGEGNRREANKGINFDV